MMRSEALGFPSLLLPSSSPSFFFLPLFLLISLAGLLSSMATAAHEEVARGRGGPLGRGRHRGERRTGLEGGTARKGSATGEPLGSYLKAKEL